MERIISQYGMFIMLGILLLAMMWFSNRSRQKAAEKQAERERQLAEELVPGAWVRTAVGFWGRFVDQDGDIVVLETADGSEMYWDRQMIREVAAQPPFASDLEDTDEDSEIEGQSFRDLPSEAANEEKN